jgi:hypothetical protein
MCVCVCLSLSLSLSVCEAEGPGARAHIVNVIEGASHGHAKEAVHARQQMRGGRAGPCTCVSRRCRQCTQATHQGRPGGARVLQGRHTRTPSGRRAHNAHAAPGMDLRM